MNVSEEQVWAYLAGDLDDKTAQTVVEAIQKDRDLQQIAEDYRRLLGGFQHQRIKKYAAEAAEVIDQLPEEPSKESTGTTSGKSRNRHLWWWLALLLAIILAGWWFTKSKSPDPAALAHTYFQLPMDPSVAGGTAGNDFNEGLDAFFSRQDYASAIQLWEPIIEDSIYGTRAVYYLGHAYFLNMDYESALRALEQTSQTNPGLTRLEKQDLDWNILMTRLALGQDVRAAVQQLSSSTKRDDLLQQLPNRK